MKFEASLPKPKPTKAAIRRAITAFEQTGFSSHSPVGAVGAHILNHCVASGVPFMLAYYPKMGASIWRLPKDPSEWPMGLAGKLDELSKTK